MERRSVLPTSEILARGHAPTMNVLHAIGWFFPESLGGTEVYVASLATRLAAAGHSTAVVAPLAGAEAPQEYAGAIRPATAFAALSSARRVSFSIEACHGRSRRWSAC